MKGKKNGKQQKTIEDDKENGDEDYDDSYQKKTKKETSASTSTEVELGDLAVEEPVVGLPLHFDAVEKQLKLLKNRIHKYGTSANIAAVKERRRKKVEKCIELVREAIVKCEAAFSFADPEQQLLYDFDFSRLKHRFAQLQVDFIDIKEGKNKKYVTASDRERLLEGADADDGEISIVVDLNDGDTSRPDRLQEILQVQSGDLNRLATLVDLNQDTIAIGERAAARLKAQREKMELIQREVDEVGSGMKRGKKEMSSLYRNLACSKVIILLVLTVLILGLAAIITNVVLWQFGIKVFGPNSIIDNIRQKRKQSG